MREAFRVKRFSRSNKTLLGHALATIGAYEDRGIKMTLRQLYYQLVAAGTIKNNLKDIWQGPLIQEYPKEA